VHYVLFLQFSNLTCFRIRKCIYYGLSPYVTTWNPTNACAECKACRIGQIQASF